MRVFCCAWKINFPKTVCFNSFEPEIGFSQNFHFKSFPNSHAKRERERERERGKRESPDHATNPEPRSHLRLHRSTNPQTDLRPRTFNPQAFNFANDPEPLRHEPTNRSLSLCDFDFLCDFD